VRLLLETHLDPAIASELARLAPELEVELQQRWRSGALRTASDDELLTAAHEDGYVLVTFDVTTIPPLLAQR
jgi:predicted nuclease of predicted toxin-antitoxin system